MKPSRARLLVDDLGAERMKSKDSWLDIYGEEKKVAIMG